MLMRTALLWGIMQRQVAILDRRFGTTYRSHLQGDWVKKSSTSWPLKMGLTGCPETSINDYHSTPRNMLLSSSSSPLWSRAPLYPFCGFCLFPPTPHVHIHSSHPGYTVYMLSAWYNKSQRIKINSITFRGYYTCHQTYNSTPNTVEFCVLSCLCISYDSHSKHLLLLCMTTGWSA
jgi:hypothetical protein